MPLVQLCLIHFRIQTAFAAVIIYLSIFTTTYCKKNVTAFTSSRDGHT